jgi:hypothetical protein
MFCCLCSAAAQFSNYVEALTEYSALWKDVLRNMDRNMEMVIIMDMAIDMEVVMVMDMNIDMV